MSNINDDINDAINEVFDEVIGQAIADSATRIVKTQQSLGTQPSKFQAQVKPGDEIEILADEAEGYMDLKIGVRAYVISIDEELDMQIQLKDGSVITITTWGEDRTYRIVGPHAQHSAPIWAAAKPPSIVTTAGTIYAAPSAGTYSITVSGSAGGGGLIDPNPPQSTLVPKEVNVTNFNNEPYDSLWDKYGLD